MSLFLSLSELKAIFENHEVNKMLMEQHFNVSHIYPELGSRGLAALFDPDDDDVCLHHPSSTVMIQHVKQVPAAYYLFKKSYLGPPELLFNAWKDEDHEDWESFRKTVLDEQEFQMEKGWIVIGSVDGNVDEGVGED